MSRKKDWNRLGVAQIFIFAFMTLAALPLTSYFQIGNVRAYFFGLAALLFGFSLLTGTKFRLATAHKVFFLLFLLIMFSYIHTRAPAYGLSKLTLIAGYFVVLPIIIFNWVNRPVYEKVFIWGLFAGGVFMLVLLFLSAGEPLGLLRGVDRFFRLSLGAGNPISTARYLGILVMACMYLFSSAESKFIKLGALTAGLIAITYMVATGSKGPIVALAVFLLVYVFFTYKNRFVILTIFSGLVFVSGIFLLALLPTEFLEQRVYGRVEDLSGRLPALIMTYNEIARGGFVEILFGHGIGDYGYMTTYKDVRAYPHNIFVEFIFELGLFGIVLFVYWILLHLIPFLKVNGFRRDPLGGFCVGSFAYALVNAQFTSDIPGNPFVAIFGALLLAHAQNKVMAFKTVRKNMSVPVLQKKPSATR